MSISDLLFGNKRPDEPRPDGAADAPAPKGPEPVIPSKALQKFINALSHNEAPVLIDFGAARDFGFGPEITRPLSRDWDRLKTTASSSTTNCWASLLLGCGYRNLLGGGFLAGRNNCKRRASAARLAQPS